MLSMGTPSSSCFLMLNRILMYLFTSFAATTEVGHKRVAVLFSIVSFSKSLTTVLILANMQFLFKVNVLHRDRKCCSLST